MSDIPSKIDLNQQLYPTYDGSHAPSCVSPSSYWLPTSTPIICEIGDRIPDHIVIGTPTFTDVNDDIVITPCDKVGDKCYVIGPPVCQTEWDSKPRKEIWQVSHKLSAYSAGWYNAHVVASSMSEALAICARNGITEDTIQSMHRLESSKVLY